MASLEGETPFRMNSRAEIPAVRAVALGARRPAGPGVRGLVALRAGVVLAAPGGPRRVAGAAGRVLVRPLLLEFRLLVAEGVRRPLPVHGVALGAQRRLELLVVRVLVALRAGVVLAAPVGPRRVAGAAGRVLVRTLLLEFRLLVTEGVRRPLPVHGVTLRARRRLELLVVRFLVALRAGVVLSPAEGPRRVAGAAGRVLVRALQPELRLLVTEGDRRNPRHEGVAIGAWSVLKCVFVGIAMAEGARRLQLQQTPGLMARPAFEVGMLSGSRKSGRLMVERRRFQLIVFDDSKSLSFMVGMTFETSSLHLCVEPLLREPPFPDLLVAIQTFFVRHPFAQFVAR